MRRVSQYGGETCPPHPQNFWSTPTVTLVPPSIWNFRRASHAFHHHLSWISLWSRCWLYCYHRQCYYLTYIYLFVFCQLPDLSRITRHPYGNQNGQPWIPMTFPWHSHLRLLRDFHYVPMRFHVILLIFPCDSHVIPVIFLSDWHELAVRL